MYYILFLKTAAQSQIFEETFLGLRLVKAFRLLIKRP